MPIGLSLKEKIERCRGNRSLKELAAQIDVDYPALRKYACGKRQPCKLALAELERRLNSVTK